MRELSHESGNYGNVQKIELVRESVGRDRDDARICEYDLFKAACGRVAVVCGKKVGLNIFPDLRNLFDECAADAVALFFSRVLSHGTSELAEIERNKDLLVQAVEDVFDHYRELISEVVGLGAVSYTYLRAGREKDILFDWDDMLDFEGDTAPYLIYTYARIKSILRKAEDQGFKGSVDAAAKLTAEDEYAVIRSLADFKDAVVKAAESYEPFMISRQIALIARNFNRFYNNSRILNCDSAELRDARLKLCEAVADCIKSGLDMLGIGVVEKM